ncbi:MAG: hypothetical protein IPJ89_03490 [Candidatus Iainarchaeum archaeon]|uniref:DUF2029 domain-containing protein n=1 Tax=Candidatus Iainarchaeum sp. TaxID=3101447 RepID=A0A7T9DIY2_9ARCH|nr:MAG: hypothetical protein IPJ89_03490 [Candidatus Diapherotrites archaeon]
MTSTPLSLPQFHAREFLILLQVVVLYLFSSLFQSHRTALLIITFAYLVVFLFHDNPQFRAFLALIAVFIFMFGITYEAVHQREILLSQFNTSDAVVQMESAGKLFLHGKNPYAEDYFGTELQEIDDLNTEKTYWKKLGLDHNPAMYHFAYPPGAFLIPAALTSVTGPIDLRLLFLPFELLGLILLFMLIRHHELKILGVLLWGLLHLFGGLAIGAMDLFIISILLIALLLMQRNHHLAAAVLFGIMGAVKQSVWIVIGLVLIWAFWQKKLKTYMVAPIIVVLVLLPFLLWNPVAMVDDMLLYFANATAYAYPINIEAGGMPLLLQTIGLSFAQIQAFPYFVLQLLVGIPLLVLIARKLQKMSDPHYIYVYSGVLVFGVAVVYKFPHFNYFNFALTLFALGMLFIIDHGDKKIE